MGHLEAMTMRSTRRALAAAAPAHGTAGNPWSVSAVTGFATRRTAMRPKDICRPPEAPT